MSVNKRPQNQKFQPKVGNGVQALINAYLVKVQTSFSLYYPCLPCSGSWTLSEKLYKNSLTVGFSYRILFLAKSVVLASIALMQILISLVIAFVPATIPNGSRNYARRIYWQSPSTIGLQSSAFLLGFPLFPSFSM